MQKNAFHEIWTWISQSSWRIRVGGCNRVLKKFHLMVAFRVFQRVETKGRKESSSPLVETSIDATASLVKFKHLPLRLPCVITGFILLSVHNHLFAASIFVFSISHISNDRSICIPAALLFVRFGSSLPSIFFAAGDCGSCDDPFFCHCYVLYPQKYRLSYDQFLHLHPLKFLTTHVISDRFF